MGIKICNSDSHDWLYRPVYGCSDSFVLYITSPIRANTNAINITGNKTGALTLMMNKTFVYSKFDPVSCSAFTCSFFHHNVYTTGGKRCFRLSSLSPDGGLWKALKCLQNIPWRMLNILLFCAVRFLLISPSHSLSHQIVSG